LCCPKKKFGTIQKTITPPCKLNGRSLKERNTDIPAVDPVDFQDHFDSLNSIQDKFDSALMKMKVKLNTLETNSKNLTGLDETY
jgi:hypothetical protein